MRQVDQTEHVDEAPSMLSEIYTSHPPRTADMTVAAAVAAAPPMATEQRTRYWG
jgi:hypothetical protein